MEKAIFYFFAAILLLAATLVVTARNPVHSALSLVLAFFSSAALWLLIEAEFLGIALVLVYVGAVMVLFLFVVMMLDINLSVMREGFARYLPLGVLVGLVMVLQMLLVIGAGVIDLEPAQQAAAGGALDGNNIRLLGSVLYTVYVYPFELAAIVLLLAIIAAIMLTHRRRGDTKHQDIAAQVRTRKADRLRMVRMPSERDSDS
ncbi:NADH-quinone oxidoreductase subunit J [Spiribacter aquaticus]|uniref:NADH-quinone oxidoreductase subunit J n=1 Tax=Spiribacter aquaticus TaxID=1935996 RepID=A0A557RKL1_9GAMM|nr:MULTISPECIES: NADH-quinone oxidoreductase subunit J [Spiribacter]KAF0280966.1 NADH:ubiquinone oxidoreductase subunit J [Spiribacter roseus]KAF0282252.1 NADH:ubiquinone oxidoreductase subunit J [Spiribacter roseus]PYZ99976.1 NADH-quinone oxidoreductase subunit J [Gammaproteobacteria bacterium 2W06]TVO65709.1 NADH-quinone oxidoreductase subunit J [Spiribacter aquaticus]